MILLRAFDRLDVITDYTKRARTDQSLEGIRKLCKESPEEAQARADEIIRNPIFHMLAKQGHVLAISWLYVMTVILGLTLSIEIGQNITGTGIMEFSDIMFGVGGFLLMFAIFAVLRAIVLLIVRETKALKKKS